MYSVVITRHAFKVCKVPGADAILETSPKSLANVLPTNLDYVAFRRNVVYVGGRVHVVQIWTSHTDTCGGKRSGERVELRDST